MLNTDEKAPEFTLPDQDGHDISLSSLIKDGPAILYFYPADFTPGCTREACSIRDLHRELRPQLRQARRSRVYSGSGSRAPSDMHSVLQRSRVTTRCHSIFWWSMVSDRTPL